MNKLQRTFNRNPNSFVKKKCPWKCLRNDVHFASSIMCWLEIAVSDINVIPPINYDCIMSSGNTLIARFMGPTWGPSGADRTQMGPMLAPWTLLSGQLPGLFPWYPFLDSSYWRSFEYWVSVDSIYGYPMVMMRCPVAWTRRHVVMSPTNNTIKNIQLLYHVFTSFIFVALKTALFFENLHLKLACYVMEYFLFQACVYYASLLLSPGPSI